MSPEAQAGSSSNRDRDVLQPGTELSRYTIERKLGQGGFGIVYLARHSDLERVVAIKEFLPVELATRDGHSVRPRSLEYQEVFEDGLRRFLDEAKRLVQFRDHPNIVSCTDFFRSNGTAYLVMEYEDAVPLSRLLREREANATPFGEAELIALIEPLLGALSQIHSAGVLHRDIKPSNILVRREDQQPVLIDFGAAKQVVSGHTKSMAPYTDGYAALEQVGDGKLGPWTDLYAIGAVMWRVVASGDPPWEPPEPVKVESRASAEVHRHQDPLPSAQTLGAGRFSLDVLEAIDRCMRLNERDRIQSSDELRRLFQQQRLPERRASDRPGQPHSAAKATRAKNPTRSGGVRSTKRELTTMGWISAACAAILLGTWLASDKADTTKPIVRTKPPVRTAPGISPVPSPAQSNAKSPFTVRTVPSSASVSLLNSPAPYKHGMALVPGWYQVRVTAPGHHDWSGIVQHGDEPTVRTVRLLRTEPIPAPVAREPTKFTFSIKPEPANAVVALLTGSEPYRQGMVLPPGQYQVRVTAPGHDEWSETVQHGPGPTLKLVKLRKSEAQLARTASFHLTLEPPEAGVAFVGRNESFHQGMDLPLGAHEVEVSAPGFTPRREQVEHVGTEPYRIALVPAKTLFSIAPKPSNAVVKLLTGGVTYEAGIKLAPGRYRIQVSAPGYETWEGVVEHGTTPTRQSISLKSESRYFTRGSHQEDILRIHGTPDDIDTYSKHEVWTYGRDSVDIDLRTKTVLNWTNRTGDLKVRLPPGRNVTTASHFTRGSHQDDVLRIQGTPDDINTYSKHEVWTYGRDSVDIDLKTKTVLNWTNRTGDLKVRLPPGRNVTTASHFTRGSHQDDVLRIQGTPDDINTYSKHEVWTYDRDSVDIDLRTKTVLNWTNRTGDLKVRLPPGRNVTTASHFTRGSHQDDVLRIQGTPDDINTYSKHEVWTYGRDSVDIDLKTKTVLNWSNRQGGLKVRLD